MIIVLVTDHLISLCFTASAKIGLQGSTCRVCLEEDGTTIDEDEVLAELKGQTLLIMTEVQYIVGDGCVIKIEARRSTAYGLLALLLSYYVFDANYPAQYAMLFAVLQIFVMQEPFTKETCQKFKFFVKKLRPVFDRMVVPESDCLD